MSFGLVLVALLLPLPAAAQRTARTPTREEVAAEQEFLQRTAQRTVWYRGAGVPSGQSLPATQSFHASGTAMESARATVSDVNRKANLRAVNTEDILQKVARLYIPQWTYRGSARRYIGPTAQDFHALFGLGDNTTIAQQDINGVTLAAVQALEWRTAELRRDNEALGAESAQLRDELDVLRYSYEDLLRRVVRLESLNTDRDRDRVQSDP